MMAAIRRLTSDLDGRHTRREREDRYARGQDTRRLLGGGTLGTGSVPGVWEMAPDLERILGAALFGTIGRAKPSARCNARS